MKHLRMALTLLPLLTGAAFLGCSGSSGGSSSGVVVAPVQSGSSQSTTPPGSTGTSGGTTTPPANNGTPPMTAAQVPTTAEDRYYDPHVRSTLFAYCTTCHADPSNSAFFAYQLNGSPGDDNSFNNTLSRVDLNDPEGSFLIAKMSNAVPHGGGAILNPSDVGYEHILNWVRQGAVRDRFAAGPRTFVQHVQPILDRQCFGCHAGGTGGYTAGSNSTTNYNEFLGVTDANNPTQSLVLRKNDGSLGHVGLAAWPVGSAERDLILQWIADGQRFAQ